MTAKKTPSRKCIGCDEMKDKPSLLRIVRSAEGEISFDPTGKKAGRGAYICTESACLQKAKKTRRLERSFSAKISDEVYAELEKRLDELKTNHGGACN